MLLRRVAHLKTNFFRSSNRVFDFHDQKYGFGGGLQLVTVYGEESRAPVIISGRANYRISDYGYVPLEIMIRLEGNFLRQLIFSSVLLHFLSCRC